MVLSLSPATTVLLVTWQASLKPYKHQITHLGRVDIVISGKIFFFGKFQLEERENPDGRAQTYPTYPGMGPAQARRKREKIFAAAIRQDHPLEGSDPDSQTRSQTPRLASPLEDT